MPIPKPKPTETKEDFVKRCVQYEIDKGIEKDKALGICYSAWGEAKNRLNILKNNKLNYGKYNK